jgi:hemoglobin
MNKSQIVTLAVSVVLAATIGCRTGTEKKKDEFFTSGSREADQRATQRMAKEQQISNAGSTGSAPDGKEEGERKRTLFERLGGEQGIAAIVDDFTTRALADPRVNWDRTGVKRGGFMRRDQSGALWQATPENVTSLKQHLVQFIALATGGPAKYEGKGIASAHAAMRISNPEFDAAVGDLKASLDKHQIPTKEQKELLAIIESTRPQIVTER